MDQFPQLVAELKGLARPDTNEYFLLMALLASTRGTCGRRRVGCVLVDVHNHVISTGYNGVAAGTKHCIDHGCPGRDMASGTGLDKCEALHAEENALIQCTRPNEIHSVYSTTSPCIHCVRRLMNTGAKRIVFAEEYPHPESANLWILSRADHMGSTWIHLPWNKLPSIANIRVDRSGPGPVSSVDQILDTVTLPLRAAVLAGSQTQSSPTPQGERWNNSPD